MFGTWLLVFGASAAEFEPEAQVRPRWEADSGRGGLPGEGNVSFTTMRTRLGGTLTSGPIAAHIVFSDSRAFGEEADTRRDFSADGFDMPIGTLSYKPGEVELMVGRMQVPLANERLLAIANWRQPGRSFDGVRLAWERDERSVEARALLIREGDAFDFTVADQVTPAEDDQQLFTLTAGWGDVLVLGLHQWDGTSTQSTAGLLYRGSPVEGLRVEAEAYGQMRTEETDFAAMAAVEAVYTLDASWKPKLGAQYDWLSGASDGLGAFNTIYGANHRYYGNIDMAVFFVGGFKDGQGLHAPAVLLRLAPAEGWGIKLDTHAFFAEQPLDDAFLAVEPNLTVKRTLAKGLAAVGGVNVWLPADADAREVMGWAMLDLRL